VKHPITIMKGIANAGSTCYINTCLQCIGHCDIFIEYILSFCSEDPPLENKLLTEVIRLYLQLWKNNEPMQNPRRLLQAISEKITCIDVYDQNDIGEFLVLFIDKLNASISKKLTKSSRPTSRRTKLISDFADQQIVMDNAWFESVKNEYSPLVPMFYGQNITQIKCGCCNKIHHNYEMFSTLMIPLVQDAESLEDCLNHYFKMEKVNDWNCDGCNNSNNNNLDPNIKSHIIWRCPSILIIMIKRFTDNLKKNNKGLSIPLELDMSKYSMDQKNTKYELVSVGFHLGSFYGGHYYATCKNFTDNKWYDIDDMDVREVREDADLDLSKGYMYCYQVV